MAEHTDDPTRDGNLTDAEYEATYTEPGTEGPCRQYPEGLIEGILERLDAEGSAGHE